MQWFFYPCPQTLRLPTYMQWRPFQHEVLITFIGLKYEIDFFLHRAQTGQATVYRISVGFSAVTVLNCVENLQLRLETVAAETSGLVNFLMFKDPSDIFYTLLLILIRR